MGAAKDIGDSEQTARHRQRCRRLGLLLPVILAAVISGCTVSGVRTDAAPQGSKKAQPGTDTPVITPTGDNDSRLAVTGLQALQAEDVLAPTSIWQRLRRGFRLSHIDHPRIQRQIRYMRRSPDDFRNLMVRAEPYLHYILNEIEDAGLPTELALLPAIESGFRPHVYSVDGAAGLWQFMPSTGRMMDLDQDWWFDKRRAIRPSTRAAIGYLERLNARFSGDWLHTLAAYNAGSAKVKRAIRRARKRGESTVFWSLDLPGETDIYVPRLLAVAAIIADPEQHRVELPWIDDRPYFALASTAGPIDLNVAAELVNLPVEDVIRLNAGHKRWATRPDGPHELLLPADKVAAFEDAIAALPLEKRLRWQLHTVRPGDSLNRIARDYGVTAKAIRLANDMQGSRIRAGQALLIPVADPVNLANAGLNPNSKQRLRYRVRKGDSLYTIARRFQVSVADLRRWNQVGRFIHPGERLTVFVDPDA